MGNAVAFMAGLAVLTLWMGPVADAAEPITPIVADTKVDAKVVALGERLFNSRLLSGNQAMSCASCHDLMRLGGADGHPISIGPHGKPGIRNTPSIFNVGLNFAQFWDGHADTLQDQFGRVLKDPNGMASDWSTTLSRLEADPEMHGLFRAVFGGPPTRDNVVSSITEYERSLTTPDARFDRYLRGETAALDADEIRGYALFKDFGCAACHQGANVGGNMFQPLGIIGHAGDYFRDRGNVTPQDLGRYNVTHDDADKFVFKVPSLRNVALTAPYFNDGSVATLPEAVRLMGHYQLGRNLSERDIILIVKFLNTLTGVYRGQPLARASTKAAP